MYAYALGWPGLSRLHKGLFYLSGRALGLLNYASPEVSGEHWIVRSQIGSMIAPVVFDLGANEGDWLAAVREINGSAVIHAFEPQVRLAAQIVEKHPSVKVNVAAVGDSPGFLHLYDYADHPGSQHASLLTGVIDSVHGGKVRRTKVPVVTLDDYCREHNILHIDFLKIDVEGYELPVLKGARRMIEEGRIIAIQLEFTHLNVLGRVFVDDFAKCLKQHYVLYRLLPHGLVPLRHDDHWLNEQFVYQNILALKNASIEPAAAVRRGAQENI